MRTLIQNVVGLLLEAEVPDQSSAGFEERYRNATGDVISTQMTDHYHAQNNKWAPELRVYFNDPQLMELLANETFIVEQREAGYLSEQYAYRINNNDFWWFLVEQRGARIGTN